MNGPAAGLWATGFIIGAPLIVLAGRRLRRFIGEVRVYRAEQRAEDARKVAEHDAYQAELDAARAEFAAAARAREEVSATVKAQAAREQRPIGRDIEVLR